MTLTPRETATVLAALRHLQESYPVWTELIEDWEDHFAECSPLQPDEVDDLCERLNETTNHEDSIHAD